MMCKPRLFKMDFYLEVHGTRPTPDMSGRGGPVDQDAKKIASAMIVAGLTADPRTMRMARERATGDAAEHLRQMFDRVWEELPAHPSIEEVNRGLGAFYMHMRCKERTPESALQAFRDAICG